MNLDGTLTAHSTAAGDFLSLAFATLTITVSDSDGVIDLDGNSGNSTINVLRNDTLVINGGVLDSAYSGTINLSAGRHVQQKRCLVAQRDAQRQHGRRHRGDDFRRRASRRLAGRSTSMPAKRSAFRASFDATTESIVNNGLIIFNNAATIDQSRRSFKPAPQGSIEVNANVESFDQGWDWDGDGGTDNVITI